MVSALVSGRPVQIEPWPGTTCCLLQQDSLLSVSLSTQVNKWEPAILMLGETELSSDLIGHLDRIDLTYLIEGGWELSVRRGGLFWGGDRFSPQVKALRDFITPVRH